MQAGFPVPPDQRKKARHQTNTADLRSELMSELIQNQSSGRDLETQDLSCEKHGLYKSRHVFGKIWTRCGACEKDATEQKLREAEIEAAERRKQTVDLILRRSGIPPRFAGRTFDTYKAGDERQMRVLNICKAYASKFDDRLSQGGGLVMCGMPGTGKTHLACAIANEIAGRGRTSMFVSAVAAVRRVKQTYSRASEETESGAIARFSVPELLIIDEVGVQFGSDTEKMILFEIINTRYEQMMPTILISNLTKDELSTFVGERVMDRMAEGGGVVLAFDWKSARSEAKHAGNPVHDIDWERRNKRLMNDEMFGN